MKKFSFLKNVFFKTAVLSCFVLAGCAGNKKSDESAEKVAMNAASASQENPSQVVIHDIEEPEGNRHFLWKVSDENSSVWVLGSIHFADSSFYPMDSVIETAFVASEELAVEINLSDESTSNEVATKMMQEGLLPAGKTLNSVLPPSLWNSLDSLCAAWNFPMMALQRLRPWFAATTLSTVAIQRSGIQPEYGIDVVLMDRAATEGKGIVGLETADDQVNALSGSGSSDSSDTQSDSAGIYYLKTTLREISNLDSMVTQMMRAWKTGNDSLLRVVMNEEFCDEKSGNCDGDSESEKKMKEDLENRIYTSRNAKMTNSIAQFLEEDRNVFVVIGAAHLALDEDNVIELLRRRGFRIRRY